MSQIEAIAPARVSPGASYLTKLSALLAVMDTDAVDEGVAMIQRAWDNGRQIITLGNGGSAVTALHFITDWNKMAFLAKRRPFRGRSLVDNIGLITAYSNDISYDSVFSEQLSNIAEPDDLVIAVSGSGNSKNVINAIDRAHELGCRTLGLCGFSGGELKKRAQHSVWAPVNDMQLCEDVHAIFGHIVMKTLCA
jgi:D-sedoheptulose 7-phosphate isomerase